MREDRIVLPMRPGMHWSEAQPVVLPGMETNGSNGGSGATGCTQPVPALESASGHGLSTTCGTRRKNIAAAVSATQSSSRVLGVSALRLIAPEPAKTKCAPREKVKREKAKHDPQLVAAARELRDRWMEAVNDGGPAPTLAKYEVSRAIEASPMREAVQAIELRPALRIEQAA